MNALREDGLTMAVNKPLNVISCQKCGYVNLINSSQVRDKRCRNCGVVIFRGGKTVGRLVAIARS